MVIYDAFGTVLECIGISCYGTTTPTKQDDENYYEHVTNNDICFLRTRADGTALLNDCSMDSLVPTPHTNYWNTNYDNNNNNNNNNGIPKPQKQQETLRLSVIEKIVDTACIMCTKWAQNGNLLVADRKINTRIGVKTVQYRVEVKYKLNNAWLCCIMLGWGTGGQIE